MALHPESDEDKETASGDRTWSGAPDSFRLNAGQYDFVPVSRRLLADTLTPVTAFRRLDDGSPGCLFESVIGGEKVGRYSFLALSPHLRVSARGNQVRVEKAVDRPGDDRSGDGESTAVESKFEFETQREFVHDNPMEVLRGFFHETVALSEGMPPFVGGAIGYAAYDVIRYVEHLPDSPEDDRQLPDLDFSFFHNVCVFDHVAKTVWVISLADCRGISESSGEKQIQAAFDEAASRVESLIGQLGRPSPAERLPKPIDDWDHRLDRSVGDALQFQSNFSQNDFEDAVRKCVDYIRDGDIFQVVPSQRLRVDCKVDALEVYRSLRVVNPSPFMFYVRTTECELIGCSPEIMCRVHGRTMTVRPLAGTRRRGKDAKEDRELEKELLSDPKERAEHVMLVDLGRNDVGRVAQYGSIELTEVMVVERYSHVMHISSEVQGELKEGLDAFDALASALPAGTVSGAPKVRAMEVIDEIEPHRRGPYGGAVGYVDYRGNMDTCIALRTIVARDGVFDVQAGCGVVADSNPTAEYEETMNKAKAMIAAIHWTAQRLGSQ